MNYFLWKDKGNLFRRGHTFHGILHWMPQCGEKYGMLWFLSTIMFLYCRQLKVLAPQIWRHHVFRFTFYNMSNFMFSERTYFDGTLTSKIWLWYRKTERATSKFLPYMLRAWMRFYKQNTINHSFHLILKLSRWIRRGHFLTEYSTKFQIKETCYQIIKYFQSFYLLTTLLQFLFWNSNYVPNVPLTEF